MKLKILFAIFIFCSFIKGRAQVCKAGVIYPFYYDINPDTLLSILSCSLYCTQTETAEINMFGSPQVDFKIISKFDWPSFPTKYKSIYVASQDPNAYVVLGRIDSVYSTSWSNNWWTTYVAKPFLVNDTINKPNLNWVSMGSNIDLINRDGFQTSAKNVTDWVGSMDKFIGVKYQTSTDTSYGWIRVRCPDNANCYVKDFSSTDQFAEIKEQSKKNLKIYPNPFMHEFYLEIIDFDKIQLFDCLSREINIATEISGNKTKLIVDLELPKGIYYLKLSTKNGVFSKKVIKS